jgi:hypothetical protein
MLDAGVRTTMEANLGADFGQVRVHHDAAAARSAAGLHARAYASGRDIVFGAGEYAPATAAGQRLIAHELAHVVQQSERAGAPAVQRLGIGQFFSRLFGEGTFSDAELLAYLQFLDDRARIEGDFDSDNKARAIVRKWNARQPQFHPLSIERRQLLLLEMIDGPTLDDDEAAILMLLRGSTDADVMRLLAAAGGESALKGEFHGSESDELDAFLEAWHVRAGHRPAGDAQRGANGGVIDRVEVDQDTPQTVTLRYADGRVDGDLCSTGKGTCCVDPGTAGGPSKAQTNVTDSNWTPDGTRTVELKHAVHPKSGIRWWTQFNGARGIALHEYAPVDGTPLSHGCVRLHAAFAERLYNGARKGHTVVKVTGTPRPRCDHSTLFAAWQGDFSDARADDGDAATDIRNHLRLAYGGVNDAELTRRIAARDIPRCGRRP